MHIGAPACGMNAAVRSFVRNCIYRGDVVYGIHDGIDGLIEGNVRIADSKMLLRCMNSFFAYQSGFDIIFLAIRLIRAIFTT